MSYFSKILVFTLSLLFANKFTFSQNNTIKKNNIDTSYVNFLLSQSKKLTSDNPEKAVALAIQAKTIAEKIKFAEGIGYAYKQIGIIKYIQAKYIDAIENYEHSLAIFDSLGNKNGVANLLNNIGATYFALDNGSKALDYYLRATKFSQEIGDELRTAVLFVNIGAIYLNTDTAYDKATLYLQKARSLAEKLNDTAISGVVIANLGEVYMKRNLYDSAIIYLKRSVEINRGAESEAYCLVTLSQAFTKTKDFTSALTYSNAAYDTAKNNNAKLDMTRAWITIAEIHDAQGNKKLAIKYYTEAGLMAEEIDAKAEIKNVYEGLANIYASLGDFKNAFRYQQLFTTIKDSINKNNINSKLAGRDFDLTIQKKHSEISITKEKESRTQQLKKEKNFRIGLFIGLALVLLIASIQWWHSRQRKKANILLQLQKNETEQQKEKAEKALDELKTTQTQLIQSEKMASLGELTAGIAHEIQNPLNFVNNFSEVNKELLAEMNEEIEKGNYTEVKALAKDVILNQEKINHHGKRADAIVKGMLQHSRTSSGQKELTDINVLADEYLRLSYHGLRAKDKTFNAKFETSLDPSIPKINVVPQDIGRVLLNLINNAFYAVSDKQKLQQGPYEPTVTITTKKINNKIEIKVTDNGNGIPASIKDKIFQPFFTTKPTGQGTGLGLSLSYDIITKGHNGALHVETREGEGTTFIIII